MNTAQPIRSLDDIERLKSILRRFSERDYLLFVFAINTGLRISDMLPLRAGDVRNRSFCTIREEKTNKESRVTLNSSLQLLLRDYTAPMDDAAWLFPNFKRRREHISRVQVFRILDAARKEAGFSFQLSPHSLRKTFGWHHYKRHKDVAMLQQIFHHASPSVTLRYIGISDDAIHENLMDFSL